MQRLLTCSRVIVRSSLSHRTPSLRFSHAAVRTSQPLQPTLTAASVPAPPPDELLREAKHLLRGCRNLLVLTGAGISTESGVADYRSPGRPPHRPTSHQQFMSSHLTRQRYWARSLQGYQTLAFAQPNGGHYALAYSEKHGGPVYVLL